MKEKTLYILFAWCVETDDPEQGLPYFKSRWDRPRPALKWKGVSEGVPRLLEGVRGITDSSSLLKMTFFMRADHQIRELCGSSTFLWENFSSLFRPLDPKIVEFGWHPHLYAWNERLKSWSTELENLDFIRQMLEETYRDIQKLPYRIRATRLDSFFHNIIMKTLDRLGIRIDSSAYPGQRVHSFNNFRNSFLRGIRVNVCFDWRGAPEEIYHPSPDDFRKKGGLKIWELPVMSYTASHPVFFWKPYFTPWKLITRYTGQEEHVRGLMEKIAKDGKSRLLVTHQHSSDIVRTVTGPLFRQSIRNVRLNMDIIRKYSDLYRIPFRFVHMDDIVILKEKGIL